MGADYISSIQQTLAGQEQRTKQLLTSLDPYLNSVGAPPSGVTPSSSSGGPTSAQGTDSSFSSRLNNILNWDPFGSSGLNVPGYQSAKDTTGSVIGAATKIAGISIAQVTIGIIGIGLIIGGIFFLRPVQQATSTVIKAGKKGLALAAS